MRIVAVLWSLNCVQLFVTPWTVACQAPLFFTISQSLLQFMSIQSVMPSSHLILSPFAVSPSPLLLLPLVPASGFFSVSWLLASGDQNIGTSASAGVLPVNIQC